MTNKKESFNLLAHQIEHENTLSKLYKAYSDKFPDEVIWKDLEAAEKKHAALIQQLIGKVSDDTICFKDDPNRCDNIKISIDKMNEEIAKANNEEIDLLYAFKIGFQIEESMIEREFFKSLETDAPIVEDILNKIIFDTEKHRDSLFSAVQEYLKNNDPTEYHERKKELYRTKEKSVSGKNLTDDEEVDLNRDLDHH